MAIAIGALLSKGFGVLFERVMTSAMEAGGKQIIDVISDATPSFQRHMSVTFDRCTKIRTLLNRDEPVNLLDHYVQPDFQCGNSTYSDFDLLDEVWKRKRIVITGQAGAGKTVFMKYLWITFFVDSKGKIPIFVELRRLNDVDQSDLLVYTYYNLVATQSKLERDDFSKLLSKGKFILVLDGFDEVAADRRTDVEKQILRLSNDNPDTIVVVSSRSDDRFDSWQYFSNFKVLPLPQVKVVSLLEKTNFQEETKKKFIRRIKSDGFFDRHKSFLSSPLLALMMLMTFDQFADIPEKIHIFYEQAFETLFAKHDATKEAFKRRMYCDLAIDVFKRHLAAFSIASYVDTKYEFNEDEIKRYIGKANEVEEIYIDPELFLKDLLESVCILQKEGSQYVFSHRSFQEFFAAYWLGRVRTSYLPKLVPVLSRRWSDNVLKMLFDMCQDVFEAEYIVPTLERVAESLPKKDSEKRLMNFLRLFSEAIHVEYRSSRRYGISLVGDGEEYYFKNLLVRLYAKHFDNRRNEDKKYNQYDRKVLFDKFRSSEALKGAEPISLDLDRDALKKGILRWVDNEFIDPYDIGWLEKTGFALFCDWEAECLRSLLKALLQSRGARNKTFDEIFGVGISKGGRRA